MKKFITKNTINYLLKGFFYLILSLGLPFLVFAQCESGNGLKNPLTSCTFAELIENIARIIAIIGFPLAVICIIYSGFLFVTARGNEQQLEKAKRTIFWALVGTAILLGAWAIAQAIQQFFAGL
jgi:hypothetical protein